MKPVTVGAAESGETQITSGVTAGDKVLEQVVSFKAGSGGTGGGLFGGTGGRFGGLGGAGRFGGGGFPAGGFSGGGGGAATSQPAGAADDQHPRTALPRRGRRTAW